MLTWDAYTETVYRQLSIQQRQKAFTCWGAGRRKKCHCSGVQAMSLSGEERRGVLEVHMILWNGCEHGETP